MQIKQEWIYQCFLWSKPAELELDGVVESFFCENPPWSFNQAQMKLIYSMLEEVEYWYMSRDKPIEVLITEFKEVQGHVFVEKICGFPEVDAIFEKYGGIYLGEDNFMNNLSRRRILQKYPWAREKPLFDKIDTEQELDDTIQWNLNEQQLRLLVMLFEELEDWFKSRNMNIDIDIYYIGELLDTLHIDFSSNTREVFLIIEKYKQFSADLLDEKGNEEDLF